MFLWDRQKCIKTIYQTAKQVNSQCSNARWIDSAVNRIVHLGIIPWL